MSWDITYHSEPPLNPKIGDMWPAQYMIESSRLSNYFRHNWEGKRLPLIVVLPGNGRFGDHFCIDIYATGDESKKGWTVRINGDLVDGQKPDITMEPSINCVGSYHGYIRNGVITDDVEGRTFPVVP
jgi:hypothetical protein